MLRIVAILFGIGFIFIGVAGFVPSLTTNGQLFGLLESGVMENVFHLICGVLAIMAATSYRSSKWLFQNLGVLFAIIAIIGFARNGDIYIMHANLADNIMHILIAIICLYIGFAAKKSPT